MRMVKTVLKTSDIILCDDKILGTIWVPFGVPRNPWNWLIFCKNTQICMISIENDIIPWYLMVPKSFFQKVWCPTSSNHFWNWSHHSSINFCVYTANTPIWKLKKRIFWNIKKKSAEILLLIVESWFGVFGEWWVPNGLFIAHLSNGTQNFLPSHFCLFSNQWRFLKPTTFFWCLEKYP